MEPTIYHIDNYSHLRKHSTAEPIAEIIPFPGDRIHWKNYYEQMQAKDNSAIEAVKVQRERKFSGLPLPLLTPQRLAIENEVLGF